jgi:hypothetical protein
MTSSTRLTKLYSALSAKERALLILGARKRDEASDPWVRMTVPANQIDAFNRYIGILRATTGDLSHYIAIVHTQVEQLELRYLCLCTLVLWAFSAADLTPHLAKPQSAAARELIDETPLRLAVDPKSLRHGEEAPSSERLAALLSDTLRDGTVVRARELAAVELVLGELAGELDGEDLLHPHIRSLLDAGKAKLQELREEMEPFGVVVEPQEPPDFLVEQLREIARREIEP